jgi:hypothetical protein
MPTIVTVSLVKRTVSSRKPVTGVRVGDAAKVEGVTQSAAASASA